MGVKIRDDDEGLGEKLILQIQHGYTGTTFPIELKRPVIGRAERCTRQKQIMQHHGKVV